MQALVAPFRIPAKPFLWPLAKNLTSQSDHDETDPSKAMIWIVLFSLMVFFLYLIGSSLIIIIIMSDNL